MLSTSSPFRHRCIFNCVRYQNLDTPSRRQEVFDGENIFDAHLEQVKSCPNSLLAYNPSIFCSRQKAEFHRAFYFYYQSGSFTDAFVLWQV